MTPDIQTFEKALVKSIYFLSMLGMVSSFAGMTFALIDGMKGKLLLWEAFVICMMFAFFFVIFVIINRMCAEGSIIVPSNTDENREL